MKFRFQLFFRRYENVINAFPTCNWIIGPILNKKFLIDEGEREKMRNFPHQPSHSLARNISWAMIERESSSSKKVREKLFSTRCRAALKTNSDPWWDVLPEPAEEQTTKVSFDFRFISNLWRCSLSRADDYPPLLVSPNPNAISVSR